MTAQPATRRRRSRPGIPMRVRTGGLVPADIAATNAYRRKRVKVGDVVLVDFKLLRNPKFHRLVHALGELCVQNIDDFKNVDAHGAIKKIQLEADIHCASMLIRADGFWSQITDWMTANVGELLRPALTLIGSLIAGKEISVRVPDSIAFDEMDEAIFHDLYARMCRHIAATYWPDLSEQRIADMAELMPVEQT